MGLLGLDAHTMLILDLGFLVLIGFLCLFEDVDKMLSLLELAMLISNSQVILTVVTTLPDLFTTVIVSIRGILAMLLKMNVSFDCYIYFLELKA